MFLTHDEMSVPEPMASPTDPPSVTIAAPPPEAPTAAAPSEVEDEMARLRSYPWVHNGAAVVPIDWMNVPDEIEEYEDTDPGVDQDLHYLMTRHLDLHAGSETAAGYAEGNPQVPHPVVTPGVSRARGPIGHQSTSSPVRVCSREAELSARYVDECIDNCVPEVDRKTRAFLQGFQCPLSLECVRDPVMAGGHLYERSYWKKAVECHRLTYGSSAYMRNPMTGERLRNSMHMRVPWVRQQIQAWVETWLQMDAGAAYQHIGDLLGASTSAQLEVEAVENMEEDPGAPRAPRGPTRAVSRVDARGWPRDRAARRALFRLADPETRNFIADAQAWGGELNREVTDMPWVTEMPWPYPNPPDPSTLHDVTNQLGDTTTYEPGSQPRTHTHVPG